MSTVIEERRTQQEPMPYSRYRCREQVSAGGRALPQDVREVLGFLEGAFPKLHDRRMLPRWKYIARAALASGGRVSDLWLRDLNRYNAGFVTRHRFQVGTTGPVGFDLPGGGRCEARGRVMRCREILPGWYEGYVDFYSNLSEEVVELTRPEK